MNNTTPGQQLATPEPSRPKVRDLVEKGIDALPAGTGARVPISSAAGGFTFGDMAQVMDFARAMSTSSQFLPPAFRANVGMCLAVAIQALEWNMSPFAVANKAYVVNDRVAYESQLIHAIVEARAPLEGRLRCRYEGEGETRKCFVEGTFIGETHPHEYESPPLGKISPKNSPLWKSDPDQQLWYYSSRAWARKWCPDVLMGIYSKEEIQANPRIGLEDREEGPGLHARLTAGQRSDEGHRPGHVESELSQIRGAGNTTIELEADQDQPAGNGAQDAPAEEQATQQPEKAGGKAKAARKGAGKAKDEPQAESKPRDAAEYVTYAEAWINAATDPEKAKERWDSERTMRSDLLVGGKSRIRLEGLLEKKHGV